MRIEKETRNVEIDSKRGFEVTTVAAYIPDTGHLIELWDDGIEDLPFLVKIDGIPYTPDDVKCIEAQGGEGTYTLGVVLNTGEEFFGWAGENNGDLFVERLESLRTLAGISARPRKCEGCDHCAFPGIRWPASPDENTERSWVEACDECERFDDDEQAARYLGVFYDTDIGLHPLASGSERYYIDRPERA
jgi:hypothetical protein